METSKIGGIKEIKTFEMYDLEKLAGSLAAKYDISHKEYDGLGCSGFKTKYCYEFRDKVNGKLRGTLEYVIGCRWEDYWCNFELDNTVINLKLPKYDKYGLPNALHEHSKHKNREEIEKERKEKRNRERIEREEEEIRSINRAVARYYETGDSHDFIGE